jgi:hypothetical protein
MHTKLMMNLIRRNHVPQMLAVYLKTLGFSESQIGQVFTFTLLGDGAYLLIHHKQESVCDKLRVRPALVTSQL